jgi:hypothetical protein
MNVGNLVNNFRIKETKLGTNVGKLREVRLFEWVVAADVSMSWIRSSIDRRCLLNRYAGNKKTF